MIATRYSRKPRKCPACGSKRIARILYGLPAFSDELQRDLEEGKITLGGCCIRDDDPVWQCADCDMEFYKKTTISIVGHNPESEELNDF